ncbi:MAG: MotA/TolQ/ExbB proton channel family protein [Deltaproteobacteria bacterium]|nr:MotA/TolQ/ExbB proton channel family protein [Deltaproteobacteria bacterium]MBW2106952.1 MotA/TolQ/ExbB proton channel family protein [Deltaproteobacteria bacterium]MBW2333155.1 MotA/TolQ/ExbB proton channel family protein [Deltaproteobacteria bacterium]RLB20887.1 MAG: biopolymer transporter [Deltaproteobacteria bacterium]HDH87385.1 MotA/TolQ/ExbB proton channel family protein [Desulfobacteraceae bacterium]
MDLGALLKSFIYIISSSLLYPVLFLLVVLTCWILIYSGSFFAEWLERIRLKKYPPERLPQIIRQGDNPGVFPQRINTYIKELRLLLNNKDRSTEADIENFLQEKTLNLWKSLDRSRMVIRIGPSLGLLGTLIPMGTGLAALGQGDMTRLSSDLVIAFTTTVVGLAIGTVAYFFYTIKRRWVEEDIKNIELATEILAGKILEEKER